MFLSSRAFTVCPQAKGDNFKILDLPRSASKTEIRAKYRALALDVHPDKNPQKDAQEAFQLLSCAFREV